MSAPNVKLVPLSKLRESPDNPRKLFGDLGDLTESLKSQGMLQPIVARPAADGELEVVIGHRRSRAAKLAGLKEVPVIVREMSRQEALEAMLVENSQREDVHPLELADGYQMLRRDFGMNAPAIAERVGLSKESVFATMKLLELVDEVRKPFLQGKISASSALELARIDGERLQIAALNDVLKLSKDGAQPSVRSVQRLIRDRYTGKAKKGLSKQQKERRALGEKVATRRRVLQRLLVRVAELVERKHHLDETDLRAAVLALAETGGESAREVFQRRGLRPDRLGKVGATQLRGLLVELPLAAWVSLDGEEYSASAKATAKAYGLSLAEMEKNVEAEAAAEGLFEAPSR